MAMLADHTNAVALPAVAPSAPWASPAGDGIRIITEAEMEKMSAAELDALIADLRAQQQREAARQSVYRKRMKSRCNGGSLLSLYGGDADEEDGALPAEDPAAGDMENLCGDMDRIGRDMWVAYLQHLRSLK